METYILVATEDHLDKYGHGLMIEQTLGHPKLNPAVFAQLIAHDIVEHQNGPEAIGTGLDELQALGAVFYVRGFPSRRPIVMTEDIRNVWRHLNDDDETLEPLARVECPHRGWFVEHVHLALHRVGSPPNPFATRIDWKKPERTPDQALINTTVDLLCLGYNKAVERYASRQIAHETFHNVEIKVNRAYYLEGPYHKTVFKPAKFQLALDPQTAEVTIERID